jgi:hypothetical protein
LKWSKIRLQSDGSLAFSDGINRFWMCAGGDCTPA